MGIIEIPVFIFTVSVVVDTAIVVRRRGEGTPSYGIMLHNAIIEKEELYMEERLQKLLAQAGLCSRREAERWIDDGRVTVNGKKASVGDKADPRRDKIFVGRQAHRRCRGEGILNAVQAARLCHDDEGRARPQDGLPIWCAAAVRVSCRSAVWTTTPRVCCC